MQVGGHDLEDAIAMFRWAECERGPSASDLVLWTRLDVVRLWVRIRLLSMGVWMEFDVVRLLVRIRLLTRGVWMEFEFDERELGMGVVHNIPRLLRLLS